MNAQAQTLEQFTASNRVYCHDWDKEQASKDLEIVARRMAALNARPGPRVGDFAVMPNGDLHRFTYDWHDSLQTAPASWGSYYLGNGYVSYSGSLEPSIANERIQPTNETRFGHIWIFSRDWAKADNGVDTTAEFRVFDILPEPANVK